MHYASCFVASLVTVFSANSFASDIRADLDRLADVVFDLHIMSAAETGIIGYRAGPFLAAMDILHITVQGRTTHDAAPWTGAAFDGGLHGDEQQAVTT